MIRFRPSEWLASPRVQIGLIVSLLALIGVMAYPVYLYAHGSWHWRKAQAAIAARDYKTAQIHLDICRRDWPNSGETAFLSARTARRAGDLEKWYHDLNDARRLKWVSEDIDMELALVAAKNGEYAPHLGFFLACLRLGHPDAILIDEVLEPAAMANLDLQLVQVCLDSWLKLDPTNPVPYLEAGELKERFGNLSGALTDFEKAVEYGPENAKAHQKVGNLLLEMKRAPEAFPHYKWLEQHDPADPKTQLGLARYQNGMGQDAEAKVILKQLLHDDPKNGRAMALWGSIELASGHPAEAETWFRKALKNMPSEIDVMFELYRSLNAQGKTAEAEEAKKNWEAARAAQLEVAELMKKISANPTDPDPIVQVASRMMEFGMEDEAKRWLDLAIKRDPRYPPTLKAFARYYEKKNDPAHRQDYLNILNSLTPKSTMNHSPAVKP